VVVERLHAREADVAEVEEGQVAAGRIEVARNSLSNAATLSPYSFKPTTWSAKVESDGDLMAWRQGA